MTKTDECVFGDYNQVEYDIYAGKVFSVFLIINILNIFIKQTIETGLIVSLLTPVLGILYLFYLAYNWRKIRRCARGLLKWEILFLVIISISLIMNRSIAGGILRRCIWIFSFCIPLAAIAAKVKDKKLFLEQTKLASFVVFFCVSASILMSYRTYHRFSSQNYNMTIGYAGIYALFFHFSKGRDNHLYYILAAIEAVLIIMGGSRGQLLCIGVFCILFINRPLNTKKRILVTAIGLLAIFMLALSWGLIADILLKVVDKFGSRTLSLLVQGRIALNTDRAEIWVDMFNYIKQKPVFGWGLSGELNFMHSYPHNLFIEIIMHYGIPIGAFVGVVLIIIALSTLFRKTDNDVNIILFSSGFMPLMLSSTYTQEPLFWIYIAISFASAYAMNKGRLTNKSHI